MLARSPVTVQRRANSFGVIMVCRQTVCLSRQYAGEVVTVHVSDTTFTIDLDEGPRTVRRTTDIPIRNTKLTDPARSTMFPRSPVAHVLGQKRQASHGTRH